MSSAPMTTVPEELTRDIYEVANQLIGYVDESTPEDLADFLLREGKEAGKLANEIAQLRAAISPPIDAGPVAWRWFNRASEDYDYIDNEKGDYDAYRGPYHRDQFTPLYTHPAPAPGPADAVSEAEAALEGMCRLYESKWSDEPPELAAARACLEAAQRARK